MNSLERAIYTALLGEKELITLTQEQRISLARKLRMVFERYLGKPPIAISRDNMKDAILDRIDIERRKINSEL